MNNTQQQLLSLFNILFSAESLRKNVYIFNSLNQHMEIPVKTILKQRRVMQLSNNIQIIISALNRCKLVRQKNNDTYIILMKGDQTIVKVTRNQNAGKLIKRDVIGYAKHMKFQLLDQKQKQKDYLQLSFLSHAAAIEFMERIKSVNQGYITELKQKDPYKCLEQSISVYRKDKQAKINQSMNQNVNVNQQYHYNQMNQQAYNSYDYSQMYASYYPIFIRKAVNSEDQQQNVQKAKGNNKNRKYVEKQKTEINQNIVNQQRVRLNSEDFPSFQTLNSNINDKLNLEQGKEEQKRIEQQVDKKEA